MQWNELNTSRMSVIILSKTILNCSSIEKRIPKDLVREYTTPEGGKVREVGPMVYGYSMNVGPDGKPRIREFSNVKPSRFGIGGFTKPEISGEIEPLVDVTRTDKEVKVVAEMPGMSKDKIIVN